MIDTPTLYYVGRYNCGLSFSPRLISIFPRKIPKLPTAGTDRTTSTVAVRPTHQLYCKYISHAQNTPSLLCTPHLIIPVSPQSTDYPLPLPLSSAPPPPAPPKPGWLCLGLGLGLSCSVRLLRRREAQWECMHGDIYKAGLH